MSWEKKRRSAVKLYLRYLRQQRNTFFFLIFLNLLVFSGIVYFLFSVWAGQFSSTFSSVLYKALCTVPVCFIEIFFLQRLYKSYKFNKSLKDERQNFRGVLPENPTNSIRDLYLKSHIFKNNFYWTVFAIIGLLVVTIFYSLIAGGIVKLTSGSVALFTATTWNSFNIKTFFSDGSTAAVMGSLFAIPVVFLSYFFFTLKSSRIISNFEAMYGKEKIIDITYLEFKTHKNNKRNKMYVFIILCILGFLIYFFFKKIILAVFNKSFH